MAVRLEARVHRYIGLSSDDKPKAGMPVDMDGNEITEGDIPVGSSFLETDTGTISHWNGREWAYADNPEVVELRAIKGLLASIAERQSHAGF